MKTAAIIIPARHDSSRFPGKPLANIHGKTMLQWVVGKAQKAAKNVNGKTIKADIYVTSESDEILKHAESLGVQTIKTSKKCKTGSDRVWEAVTKLDKKPNYVMNLQGDVPLLPSCVIEPVLKTFEKKSEWDVVTPVYRLTWTQLDKLRDRKRANSSSSGTTVVRYRDKANTDEFARALWFSKSIIPNIRDEQGERKKDPDFAPVYRHIGLYAFKYDVLKQFSSEWGQPSYNEGLEQLEQLRFLENGKKIYTVKVKVPFEIPGGIDTPEDIKLAEFLLREHPELGE